MAVHTHSHSWTGRRQALSRPPTAPRRALLRATPAALLLLLSFTACSDDAVPTRPTVEQPLHAVLPQEMVVTNTADHDDGTCDASDCTLREAINHATSPANITFAEGVTGTIDLTGELVLNVDVSIVGPGPDNLTIDANGSSTSPGRRGFAVYGTATTATISGLTVTGGYDADLGENVTEGGGIHNDGTLTLSNMVVTGNTSSVDGGGIYNSGTLTVSQSTVSNNTSEDGGGIVNSGTLVVDHTTISGNHANLSYGFGGMGGGIFANPDAVTTTVRNSTISGNTAACRGGGIDNMKVIRIEYTTITANTVASSDASSGCGGGGLQSYTNAASGEGADIVGTIVWGNSGPSGAEDVANLSSVGTFNSLGHNLIGTAGHGVTFSVDFSATGDQTGVLATETVLDPLALNDPGTTETHALPAGSPAIDAGTCTGLDGVTVTDDQRGVSRPQPAGGDCDIGAYEASSGSAPTTLVVNSLNDPGTGGCDETECTLREAVQTPGSDVTITFDPGLAGTINLIGALQLNYNVSIVGPGAEKLTIDANGSIDVNRQGFVVWSTADISGLTVTGGYANAGSGIWIASYATLTLSDMVVTGNTALTDGGGIDNLGTLTVSHSTVSNNTGTYGGGILNKGTLVVDHSTISGNEANVSSGWGGMGGGIQANSTAVTTTVSNSTISGNTAECRGGGIDNMKLIRIEYTTITANTVNSTDPSSGCGGGGLSSATMAGSGAEIVGTIVWGNSAVGAADDVVDLSDAGDFTSLGHNLIGTLGYGVTVSADFSATGDLTGVSETEAVLDALALNDPGTTETHALPEGSPAIDAGTCTGLDEVTVADDQRGVERPQGSACDIGAYEASSASLITTTFTFDLSSLPAKRYQYSPDFSVATYASSNSPGAITFALGAGSVGCTVTTAGSVHITGAAVGSDYCIIVASQADAAGYTAAEPISQSFNIAKGITYVSISNVPASGNVGSGFTPQYSTTSSGDRSTTSSTTTVCTVANDYVSFIAAGTCTLQAHVAETTNWAATDGGPQSVDVSALSTPTFTFDLSGLGTVTYGDAPFNVASYASSNSGGDITFALGSGSAGCSVTATGDVTITGTAVGTEYCVIEASQAAAGDYAAAGPLSQSFNIAKATTTVSINNLPTAAEAGGGFTPAYTTTSDGDKSTTASTTDICTVDGTTGLVSFIAEGTCTLVAHVAEGTNWVAADGAEQSVIVSAVAPLTPDFSFDLSRLRPKTYGDADFSVAGRRYVSTNSTGAVTFALRDGSVGCDVGADGTVTITGAGDCVINATLEPDALYAGAGPISQSFNIAKAATTVSISNIPTGGVVGEGFTPEYATTSDGVMSITSTTTGVCTVAGGVVSFIGVGTCTLTASVAETDDYLEAAGDPQSFEVAEDYGKIGSPSCTYSVNEKNGQSDITVSWADATPGVTLIAVTDGRDLTKQMAPTATGSWSVKLNSVPTGYSIWGGAGRGDASVPLVIGGKCELPSG